jgi:hypothetical protein
MGPHRPRHRRRVQESRRRSVRERREKGEDYAEAEYLRENEISRILGVCILRS